jgi:hypothetical protein
MLADRNPVNILSLLCDHCQFCRPTPLSVLVHFMLHQIRFFSLSFQDTKINLARLFWYLGAQMSFLKCCLDDRFTIHVISSDSCSCLKYKLQLTCHTTPRTPRYCPFRWACTMFGIVGTNTHAHTHMCIAIMQVRLGSKLCCHHPLNV